MLYVDIPTLPEIRALHRHPRRCLRVDLFADDAQTQDVKASRIAFGNQAKAAVAAIGTPPASTSAAVPCWRAELAALGEDDAFWRLQAHSLAVLATSDNVRTFRLATSVTETVEVSDRFYRKPLLRAVAFPQARLGTCPVGERGAPRRGVRRPAGGSGGGRGWGSLIWCQKTLPVSGAWQADGPVLPIEFARKSNDKRITLVITPDAPPVTILWAALAVETLAEAKAALAAREGITESERQPQHRRVERGRGGWRAARHQRMGGGQGLRPRRLDGAQAQDRGRVPERPASLTCSRVWGRSLIMTATGPKSMCGWRRGRSRRRTARRSRRPWAGRRKVWSRRRDGDTHGAGRAIRPGHPEQG